MKGQLPEGRSYLGFTQFDQPYYYACGREAFENGNGLFYANPYSNLPDSPRIYTHLVYLIFGYLWKFCGLSMGAIDQSLRFLAGPVMLILVIQIFRAALPQKRFVGLACVAVISCSGLAWLLALGRMSIDYLLNLTTPDFSQPLALWIRIYPESVGQMEGGYGEWNLDVLRNLTLTPEVIYHVLFFACILSLLKNRFYFALLFLFLAWWSHPFTGAELGLIVGGFLLVEWRFQGHRLRMPFIWASSINALFLFYYLIFLNRFPEHASVAIQARQFGNPMLFGMIPPAFGVFSIFAVLYFFTRDARRGLKENPAIRLFLVWLICVMVLVFQDRILCFMKPWQPLHFARGYLFIPLVFFSICWFQQKSERTGLGRRWIPAVSLGAIILLQLPDDFFYLARLRQYLATPESLYSISEANWNMLQKLDSIEGTLTVCSLNLPSRYARLRYLVPVYTHHRVFAGHEYNTPFMAEKSRIAGKLWPYPTAADLKESKIDLLIVNQSLLD